MRSLLVITIPIAAALVSTACSAPAIPGVESAFGQTPLTAPAPTWLDRGTFTLDANGSSAPLHLDIPRGARSIAVRARGADAAAITLDSLTTDAGETWVDDARATDDSGLLCRHCVVEIAAGDGYGLFVLPPATGVTLRVGLRDAHFGGFTADPTLTSTPVHVEVLFPPEPPSLATTHLALRVASTRNVDGTDPLIEGALEEAGRLYARAEIALAVSPTVALDVDSPAEAEVSEGDMGMLGPIASEAERALGVDSAYVPIVLVDQIRWSDPALAEVSDLAALSTRISASPAPGAAGAVFVALGNARTAILPPGADRARWLGAILAHEIGHWLGLRHDQDHAVPPASPTLMTAYVAASLPGSLSFDEAEARSLTLHPLVFFAPRNP